ncbi:hypothetical protein O0L34_g2270 [Tuta absoluta]|nr:hypothetical protein O0L34_g2270 [Tuta absoluta]
MSPPSKILVIAVVGLVLGCIAVNGKEAKTSKGPIHDGKGGRRAHGGGYAQQYTNWSTQTRIMSMVRLMIMNLLGDADSKVKKIGFIKTWAEKGVLGKAALTAKLVVRAQRIYNRMARMFIFCYDSWEKLPYYRLFWSFFVLKKLGMELDQVVQVILEYENIDPSGAFYGRRSMPGGGGRG